MVILWCVRVHILVYSCILGVLVHSCILLTCGMSCMYCHSCGPLRHFLVRGRVKVGVFGIVVVIDLIIVALITVITVIFVGRSLGGVVILIVGPALRIKERVTIPVSDIETPGIAARKTVHTVDDVLWEGEGSEALGIQYSTSRED